MRPERACNNTFATNILIEAHPENKDTILQTAQRYFVELDGNGEAWSLFHKWAEKNGIDTGWYNALIKRKKGSDA